MLSVRHFKSNRIRDITLGRNISISWQENSFVSQNSRRMSLCFVVNLQVKRSASSSESADVQPVDTQVSILDITYVLHAPLYGFGVRF